MEVVLAQPRGFCAGVVRAIEIVERALDVYDPPVYVFHEIVHNSHVVEDLHARGAVFVKDLDVVPTGSVTIFSAHGVSTAVVEKARQRNLQVIDATCPLVTKVHLQAQKFSRRGYEIVIIGHIGHEEVEGTMGSVPGKVYVVSTVGDVAALKVDNPDKLAYVTQTTLSINDTQDVIATLKQRFPTIQGPELDDICYATQNRQNAVMALADQVSLLLVVGARNSSNSNRLREVGIQHGLPAYLIQDESELDESWFDNIKKVGVTSGASTPEVLVNRVLDRLNTFGVKATRTMDGVLETTSFRLPQSLTLKKAEQNNARSTT